MSEDVNEVCDCGHPRAVHGFGMGRCWPCDLEANFMDEECEQFRPADAAEATS